MPILFGLLFGFISKIFTSGIVLKLAGFAALTAGFTVFTVSMAGYLSDVNGLLPALDPVVQQGLNILPSNTSTYLFIAASCRIAQFAFVAIAKSVKSLT